MECECGLIIQNDPDGYRNCNQCQDSDGQWYNICPECGNIYKAKD